MEISFSRDELIQAIQQINQNPELKKGRNSSTYDLIFKNKKYPPILVLSIANQSKGGKDLTLSDFGNSTTVPFKILKDNGFKIQSKINNELSTLANNHEMEIWIEKSIIKNRIDRNTGPRALGKVLWSPQRGKNGADIYKNMRLVKMNDVVLHLVDNESFVGISLVKNTVVETEGLAGTDWPEPAYLVELKDFIEFENSISRESILENKYSRVLNEINEESEVFYTNKLTLRQGAYLTPCPEKLLSIVNTEFKKINGENLPFIPDLPLPTLISTKKLNPEELIKNLKETGLIFNEILIKRFVTSILTKPFLILTGLSGSGKTKLAQAFVKWICESNKQFKVVPVGADWTNREPLLGYPNALNKEEYVKPDNGVLDLLITATENPEFPYFLILDEMNLSHVERYFADFLSAMESNEEIPLHKESKSISGVPSSIKLPRNLFIIGTVNIDETTHMFSPKVLDRANTLEFRIDASEMNHFLDNIGEVNMDALVSKGAGMAKSFVQLSLDKSPLKEDLDKINPELAKFFVELKKAGAEFGYRSATEILRLIKNLSIIDPTLTLDQKLDIAIIQKLLPKLHGSRNKLNKVLVKLAPLCLAGDFKIESEVLNKEDFDFNSDQVKYPLSLEKIARMYRSAIENGFASFAEA
jgi:5-methylcytosine-specific restriction protein B